jgi:hypothetical protein
MALGHARRIEHLEILRPALLQALSHVSVHPPAQQSLVALTELGEVAGQSREILLRSRHLLDAPLLRGDLPA